MLNALILINEGDRIVRTGAPPAPQEQGCYQEVGGDNIGGIGDENWRKATNGEKAKDARSS